MASMFLGACAAASVEPVSWGWLAATVAGIFAIEVAKNASGEIFDFDSGADQGVAEDDRSPFSGGKRVLVDGLLTRRATGLIAATCYVIGTAIGFWIGFVREPTILLIGIFGVGAAYLYHAPPLRLSYRGWGESAVVLCYGPLIAAGTCLVQAGMCPFELFLPSLSLGLLIGAFLWINEFPDEKADRAAGKHTLVVRLGRQKASRVFAMVIGGAFLIQLAAMAVAGPSQVLGFVAIVPAIAAARRLWRHHDEIREIVPAQVLTLLSFVVFSLLAGVGLLIRV